MSCARKAASDMNSALVWKVKLCFAAAAAVTAGLHEHEGQSASNPDATTAAAKLAPCEAPPRLLRKSCGRRARTLAAHSSSALPSLRPGDE
jgi:hypothetical protein